MRKKILALIAVTAFASIGDTANAAETAQHTSHEPPLDTRQLLTFPAPLVQRTLTNMRDHLLALTQIQAAIASGAFDRAADIAEFRLGTSSLDHHDAHDVAPFMPEPMQRIGMAMHVRGSEFARLAQETAVTSDPLPLIAKLSELTGTCVACHASYRLR